MDFLRLYLHIINNQYKKNAAAVNANKMNTEIKNNSDLITAAQLLDSHKTGLKAEWKTKYPKVYDYTMDVIERLEASLIEYNPNWTAYYSQWVDAAKD